MLTNLYQSGCEGNLEDWLSGTANIYADLGTSTNTPLITDTGLGQMGNLTARVSGLSFTEDRANNQHTTEWRFTSTNANSLRLYYYNGSGTAYALGGSTYLSEKFIIPFNCSVVEAKVLLKWNEAGSPCEDLNMSIQTDSSGVPSGSLVTGGSAVIPDFYESGAAWAWKTGSFTTAPSLSSGVTYYLVINCSGTSMPNNCYAWAGSSVGGFASGLGLTSNTTGSVWASGTQDYAFDLYNNKVAEVGLFTVGSSLYMHETTTPFTKDNVTELYITERTDYSVDINE